MTCKKCKLNISAMLDGCLDQEVCRQVEAHLSSCDECRKYYEALILMRDKLGNAGLEPLPEGFEQRLHFALKLEAEQPRKKQFVQHMPIIAAAAASLVLIGGAFAFSHGFGGMKAAEYDAAAPEMLQEFSAADESDSTMGATNDAAGESTERSLGIGETECPAEQEFGIMAFPEEGTDNDITQNQASLTRTISEIGITTSDDAGLTDSMNMLSASNSGTVLIHDLDDGQTSKTSLASNYMSIDIPAANYENFIAQLSSQYPVDYVNVTTEDLSDEIDSLLIQKSKLVFKILELLSLQTRTDDEESELQSLQNELSLVVDRLNELYLQCSNVQVNIVLNMKE